MSKAAGHSYFRQAGEGFIGLDPVRGPWSPDHCHAGPVAALAARAAENLAGPDMQMTRLTLDLLRPIPVAGVGVECAILRQSRSVTTTRVAVLDLAGKACATGQTMHLRRCDIGAMPTADAPPPEFSAAAPDDFPLARAHDLPCFTDFNDIRYPPGHGPGPGPKSVWMRLPGIVAGEDPSPFQRLCPIADSGNGISGNRSLHEVTFLNTDLTIHMHRPPVGAWIASDVRSHWQATGIGLSEAVLSDQHGAVAMALQTLMIRPR